MENEKERVLAYQFAKTIDMEELGEVAGGAVQPTIYPTSTAPGGFDVAHDKGPD